MRAKILTTSIALALTGAPAGAATITVNNGCTLADAITAANSNTAVGGCHAGDDQDKEGDIIELTADVVLTEVDNTLIDYLSYPDDGPNGLPVIRSTITLNGNGHTLTRANVGSPFSGGTPFFRLLHVGQEGNLAINDLTLSKGWGEGSGGFTHSGGGLLNEGHTVINKSRVTGNQANVGGGIVNTGTLKLIEAELSENTAGDGVGGLLNFGGQVELVNCTLTNNHGVEAAAIDNFAPGKLTLTNSTITGSFTRYGDGHAIINQGELALVNSTVSGSDGGVFNLGYKGSETIPHSTFIHSTIAHNGREDGWYQGGWGLRNLNANATVTNSIIANNLQDCVGPVTFEGLNLIGDGSCNAAENDQLTGDPHIGPLADNGGPTLVHALLKGSPAIDRISFTPDSGCDPTTVTADQRGISRPRGQGCDIGAVERIQPMTVMAMVAFLDRAVVEGTLAGQAPAARRKLHVFRHQLRVLGLLPRRGRESPACRRLNNLLKMAEPNSPQAFVAGLAVNELATLLKSWGNEHCQ